jgi:hypothetical protein
MSTRSIGVAMFSRKIPPVFVALTLGGCSLFANSRPAVEPGFVCWVFPGYGKICAESQAKLEALKLTLSPPDAGAL